MSPQQPNSNGNCTRQCPTPTADARALITHNVPVASCLGRQREFYHKCHKCMYRGKPASFVIGDSNSSSSGVAERTVGERTS